MKFTKIDRVFSLLLIVEFTIFTFNRNLQLGTYFGFFLQEFLLGAFICTISKYFGRIKQGKF